MDILKHFAHDSEVTQNGEILLVLVATAPMLVEIFTKGLHYQQWKACMEGIPCKTKGD